MMKVLFLDMDGVLNNSQFLMGKSRDTWPLSHIDEKAIDWLNFIVGMTDCKIVISSSWRSLRNWMQMREILAQKGFQFAESIIGQTPRYNFDNRGMEIAAWLQEHPEVKKFVILDDDADMAHLLPHLVQTNWHSGLRRVHAYEVISRLTGDQVPATVES